MNQHDPMLDHRARLERARLDAEEQREQALLGQRSAENSPDERVRIWERLHQLHMPRNPGHAILLVIARQTGLHLDQVRTVQLQRSGRILSAS